MDTQEFIKRSIKVHGDCYDYSKVHYVNARTKVEILCKKHGSFMQLPRNHYANKQGCPICAKPLLARPIRTVEDFVKKARLIHGNKYDYSKVSNPKSGSKVTIICPIHGEFLLYVNNHLLDCGCPKCSKHKKLTLEEFIERANIVHNNYYSYSKTVFTNVREQVIITCPIHGDFVLNAWTHLQGCGCPKCHKSRGEKLCQEILDKYKIPYKPLFRLVNDYFEGRVLIIDFFIKYKGKLYFIEYNGEQHYKAIEFFGGNELYEKLIQRDKLLRLFCEVYKDKVSLLEIPYYESNIEQKILSFLQYEEIIEDKNIKDSDDMKNT